MAWTVMPSVTRVNPPTGKTTKLSKWNFVLTLMVVTLLRPKSSLVLAGDAPSMATNSHAATSQRA